MNSPRPFAPHPSIASNSAVLFPRQHHPRPIPPQLLTPLTPNPPPSSKQSPTYLNKPNLRRLLPKRLPAHVESVLADQPRVLAAARDDASIISSVSYALQLQRGVGGTGKGVVRSNWGRGRHTTRAIPCRRRAGGSTRRFRGT